MNALNLIPVFITGLLGSIHCVGMCGGIVTAFTSTTRPAFPVPVIALRPPSRVPRLLAYNLGRIGSYAVAGAVAGGLANAAATFSRLASAQLVLYWAANLMLTALGLYLMNAWHGLAVIETAGQRLWRGVRPALRPLLPVDSAAKALALGAVWGWVPCAMVYSVLLSAMLSGSAIHGALIMIAFGAGTLPMLLALGSFGERLGVATRRPGVRLAAGAVVLGFGLLGLARAAAGMSLGWLDALCLVHP